ncbi:MAG: hypothetical protein QMC77_03110 [Methanocellales archaeon]|nr:hypothetical protein [Methanocellales archaeon]
MTPIEILATIFAILVLVKLLVYVVNPKPWMKLPEAMFKESTLTMIVYLILAVIVGYYVLASLSIVQVAAVMLFTAIIMGLTLIPYSKTLLKMSEEVVEVGMSPKVWLVTLIWAVIAIWVLYTVFT